MNAKKFILGVIPARGGSQAIKRKNLVDLGGVPLISHTVQAAKDSKLISKAICSTDSEEIKETVERLGGEVPFLRPESIARNETPMLPVLQHAVGYFEKNGTRPDLIVLLQPTSPFRNGKDIDTAIELFLASTADSLMSVTEVKENPLWVRVLKADRLSPLLPHPESAHYQRQQLPKYYIPNGAIFICTYETLMVKNKIEGDDCLAFIMGADKSIDIDEERDLARAQSLAQSLSNRREENFV
jgi:CMP-N-acetylneuraminic acid synthetase